jgi:hypothetical protein
MLEGKELEKNIGKYGQVSVDVTPRGEVEVAVAAKIDLLAELAKLAKKTGTEIDDVVVKGLMKLFGRTEEEILAAFA